MSDFAERQAWIKHLRAAGQLEVTYTIIINEEQRALLTNGLVALGDGLDTEGVALLTLLQDLPVTDAAQPGVINGFCL